MESTQSWIANVAILNKALAKESWYNTFFAKFSGNVDISTSDNGNKVYIPSGKPIEILNDFIAEGRDNMLIPFLRDLTGAPVFGDTVLKGTGEDQSMYWLRSYVNQYRKAVMKKSGSMSEQRQKLYKLYEAAKPQLAKWFTKYENQAIFQTFYEGVSPNLSTGTTDDGLGLARRYHPNWYVNDGDVLTSIGSEKTLKTNSELDAAIGDDAGSCDSDITAAILLELRVKCMELMIPQMVTKSGMPFWALVLHPAQMAKLQVETNYKAAQQAAFTGRALELPELGGAAGFYGGFAIYEDIIGVREWDEDNSTFMGTTIGARFAPTAVGSGVYNALVFGNNAMGKGVAKDLHFTNEVDDHENTVEIGGAAINGYNRSEFLGEGDAGEGSGDAFYKNSATAHDAIGLSAINQSSLIFTTKE